MLSFKYMSKNKALYLEGSILLIIYMLRLKKHTLFINKKQKI